MLSKIGENMSKKKVVGRKLFFFVGAVYVIREKVLSLLSLGYARTLLNVKKFCQLCDAKILVI